MSQQSEAMQRLQDEYDSLPEPIKGAVSKQEYLWMPEVQKKKIMDSECFPDVIE